MLDAQIVEREGGDFGIIRLANGRTHFKIWNPVDQFEFACTAWTHEWDHWIMNICKIQRLLRRKWLIHRFILNPNDPFGIRKIKAFLKSDQALIRPNDILNTIVVSYIEAGLNSRNFHRHKSPVTVRCIETDSFKNRIQIEQQFVANQHHIN